MAQSLNHVWIHLVWTTKYRIPYLTDDIRQTVFDHIRDKAVALGYHVTAINGWLDHVHLFMQLPRTVSFASVAHRLKGESAHWINATMLVGEPFRWQSGYGAFSVSDADRGMIKRYIENQERRHSSGKRDS